MTPEQQALAAILRTDLASFIAKVFYTVSEGDRFMPNWHIDAIAHHLAQTRERSVRRLVITQPPRSLKSISASVAFPAWILGHDPTCRIICVSYSQDLAEALARQFRRVVESPWYKALFPGTRIAKVTASEITTTRGGGRLATSTGGTLTGRGADIIIIDDPMKAADATSEVERKKVIEWFRTTLVTRLNDKTSGVIILVMQRLHEEDLVGYVTETSGWTVLDLPAYAVTEQSIPIGPDRIQRRREGEILHPEREPREQLERMRQELGSLAFSAQYQQRPVPLEGNLIRREWFQTYSVAPSGDGVIITQSWDIAGSVAEGRDYSVCTTWAIKGNNYYLLDVWRGRLEYPDLKRKVEELRKRFRARRVLIEAVGLGLSLCQDLSNGDDMFGDGWKPIRIKPKISKIVRMESQTPVIEARQVYLPESAPWLADFMNEVLAFPSGKHDDQVDSLSQFLANRGRQVEPPVLDLSGGKNPPDGFSLREFE